MRKAVIEAAPLVVSGGAGDAGDEEQGEPKPAEDAGDGRAERKGRGKKRRQREGNGGGDHG
jgi:hypothetical protein